MEEDVALTINNHIVVVVCNAIEGQVEDHWSSTQIYIYDPDNKIKDKEEFSIIEYLYSEGFILDRRTSCKIIEKYDDL